MASQSAGIALEDSWIVSELEGSIYSQPVIVGEDETAPASFSTENLTPISSYSESDLIKVYEEADTAAASFTSDFPNPEESTATLASSVSSGPELIMPSIMFESRTSDHGSWVIPRKRSKQSLYESRKVPRLPKPRVQAPSQQQDAPHLMKSNDSSTTASTISGIGTGHYFQQIKDYFSSDIQRYQFFRLLLNSLLVLTTMHLLIFPEIVHQVPAICKVPAVSRIYSQTCAGTNHNVTGAPSLSTPFQSAIRTQNQLQIYLNQTIQDMAPVDASLKDSDAILREIFTDIRKEYGSARHEIELEFEGAWTASRAITRGLMNLKLDMKATVDGFQIPTHRLESIQGAARSSRQQAGSILSRFLSREHSDVPRQEENGITAVNRFTRLNQDLDSTIARLVLRTDTLLVQLAKMDDHLQSIKSLSVREDYRLNPTVSDGIQTENMWTTLSELIRAMQSTDHPKRSDNKESKVLDELERISSYHDLMADVVGKLDKELKALQKVRTIRT